MLMRFQGEKQSIFGKSATTLYRASIHVLPQTLALSEKALSFPYQQRTEYPASAYRKVPIHPHAQLHLEKELDRLDQQCRPLSKAEYLALLKACNKCRSLPLAQRLHAHLSHYRLDSTGFLGENLLVTLSKCGALDNALHVFHSLPFKSAFAWTALISGLTDWGRPQSGLATYQNMLDDGAEPDSYTFVSLFKACGIIPDLAAGRKLHMDAHQKGFTNELLVGNTLVSMYGKCGVVVEAEHVFYEMPKRDVVTWNVMLSIYVEKEQARKAICLYRQLCEEARNLQDENTMAFVLQAVRVFAEEKEAHLLTAISSRAIAFEIGRALHAEACRKYLSSSLFVGNSFISMYASCGMMDYAINAFYGLTKPDIVSKTAILSALLEQGQAGKALQFYSKLSQEEISSNYQTFLIALQACGNLAEQEEASRLEDGEFIKATSLEIGGGIHEDARARGLETSLFVANTLISMYGKCGAISEAEKFFERFTCKDIISWNAMLSGYVEQGKAKHALCLYRQMREEGFEPDRQTFLTALQACHDMAIQMPSDFKGSAEVLVVEGCIADTLSLDIGIALHADVRRRGFSSDVFVGTTLIRMYGKYGALAGAEIAFCSLSFVDLVACTAMLCVFVEQGEEEKAFSLYKKMQEEGMSVDELTLGCILQASWRTGRVENVRQLDFVIVCSGVDSDSSVGIVALIQAYGSSGCVRDAKAVFDRLALPDLAAWNACIAANTGDVARRRSFRIFEQMWFKCVSPDALTFVSILSACTYSGLVEAGTAYFESMCRDFTLHMDVNHFVLMIDLLGRTGDLVRATDLTKRVPKQAELAAWLCLLSACRIHGNVELGKSAFDRVVGLQTNDPSAYVLMSNMCVDTGI